VPVLGRSSEVSAAAGFASIYPSVQNDSTMLVALRGTLAAISACATAASVGYCFLCSWAGISFVQRRKRATPHLIDLPPVSILKPLRGADPEMYEALRSHCMQDYPEYEILFGVSSLEDPAARAVEQLGREFPDRRIRLLVCDQRLGANGKVSTLAQLAPLAAHEFLLVNDSDIRVQNDYLRTVIGELTAPGGGSVTCLYRGVPGNSIASKLEALGINTDFMAGVLVARIIERGLHFGLGSTLAFRRTSLAKIGGFEVIVDYLADDYELGCRISQAGEGIVLSHSVVQTNLPAYNFAGFWAHQLRWARTIRASRPSGYAGLLLTFTLPWSVAAFLLHPTSWTGWLLVAALSARMAMAIVSASLVLQDRTAWRKLWLLPVRDFVAVAVWLGGLFGRKIVWHGEVFELEDGKLKPR
jgi:ceramide glucosyltransferase